MIVGAGYVFLASQERRSILTKRGEQEGLPVADPVKKFKQSTRAPIMVFGVFADGMITHLIDGRKGASAGTDLVRLNLSNWTRLSPPLDFERVIDAIAPRYRKHVLSTFKSGGLLPPKTMIALVEALIRIAPETRLRLARYSSSRRDRLRRIAPDALTNLALQKEAVSTSLAIASFPQADVLAWDLPLEDTLPRSFLDGLPEAKVREDTMLEVDHGAVPGFNLERSTQIASKVFYREDGSRLTVVMANRTKLEEQTGADLIYYHEIFKCFIFVQYKAMEVESVHHVFRWQEKATDQLLIEIQRMNDTLANLAEFPADDSKESFRLCENPFFLKLCPRIVFNPDDKGLFKGMYVPLEYWKRFSADPCSKGPKGGRIASYDNIGRKFTNFQFVHLVADAWIGTTIPQSDFLAALIREVLQTNRTVTLAIHKPADRAPDASSELSFDALGIEEEEDNNETESPLRY